MSEYINGWDMQDAISRCADLDAELARERRDHAKLVEAARVMMPLIDSLMDDYDPENLTKATIYNDSLKARNKLSAVLEAEVDDE